LFCVVVQQFFWVPPPPPPPTCDHHVCTCSPSAGVPDLAVTLSALQVIVQLTAPGTERKSTRHEVATRKFLLDGRLGRAVLSALAPPGDPAGVDSLVPHMVLEHLRVTMCSRRATTAAEHLSSLAVALGGEPSLSTVLALCRSKSEHTASRLGGFSSLSLFFHKNLFLIKKKFFFFFFFFKKTRDNNCN
jgi:hypothetical protein